MISEIIIFNVFTHFALLQIIYSFTSSFVSPASAIFMVDFGWLFFFFCLCVVSVVRCLQSQYKQSLAEEEVEKLKAKVIHPGNVNFLYFFNNYYYVFCRPSLSKLHNEKQNLTLIPLYSKYVISSLSRFPNLFVPPIDNVLRIFRLFAARRAGKQWRWERGICREIARIEATTTRVRALVGCNETRTQHRQRNACTSDSANQRYSAKICSGETSGQRTTSWHCGSRWLLSTIIAGKRYRIQRARQDT